MSGDRPIMILFYGIMVILPLTALIARRPPLGATLKMVVAWVAIFAIAIVIVSQRDRLSGLTALLSDQQISGLETRIRKGEDGHFRADVSINGVRRRMLIDSGATTTALSIGTARAAGLDLDESPFATVIETANGRVTARTATVATMTIGSITATDIGIVASPAFGDSDVVGMNFLSRLGGWRVEGDTLIMTPNRS